MALQSDTGEVNRAIVLFRKGQTRPLGVERRVPDGAGIVRKIAQGGKQEMLLYVSAVGDGAINVDDIEVYVGLLSGWVSILAAPVIVAIDTTKRIPVETYPPETFVRVTVTSEIVTLTVDNASVHAVLDTLTGLTSGATGVIDAIDGNDITVTVTSGVFEDTVTLAVDDALGHAVSDILTGLTSGATATIDAINVNDITVTVLTGKFEDGETVQDDDGLDTSIIQSIEGETVQDDNGLDTSIIQSIDLDAHIVECVAYTP